MAMTRALMSALILAGCAHKVLPPPVAQEWAPDFLDLQAGWRLKITTPLLSSGKYQIQPTEEQSSGSTITLSTGEQSIGYENAFYRIQSQSGGVRLVMISTEMFKDGKAVPDAAPRGWQPQLPADPLLMRLVYLRRSSEHDHDMAFLPARDKSSLDALTRRVQNEDQCMPPQCAWVPAGVAVVAEQQRNGEWVPVR
jgi:hypothetical protein